MCPAKLKLLMLHGCRQNSKKFREKTGAFRKIYHKFCEFDFVEAKHVIKDTSSDDVFSWWFSSRDPPRFFAVEDTEIDDGFDESIELVKNYILTNGPYDGIFAFSQGSALVALMYLMDCGVPSPKFLILVSPFKSKSTLHKKYYQNTIDIPTLIVYGNGDDRVPPELTKELISSFTNTKILVHKGGHFIPCGTEEKDEYINFIKKFSS